MGTSVMFFGRKTHDSKDFIDDDIPKRVAEFILKKGFTPASTRGRELTPPFVRSHGVGFLSNQLFKKRKHLDGISGHRRRMFPGVIWFKRYEAGADGKDFWCLEIYGYNNIRIAMDLTREIESLFNIKVLCDIERDKPRFETFLKRKSV